VTTAVTVVEDSISNLSEHAAIPIRFRVDRVLEASVRDGGLGGIALHEVPVDSPWDKDYDEIEGEGPTRWPSRFDVSMWGLLAGYEGCRRVGGVVLAWRSPGVTMLEDRHDLAVVWDLRVRPDRRGAGIGTALWRASEEWARARGCQVLKVETQNVNVAACRFYARMGCTLGAIHLGAYPELPSEAQLLWYRQL
jgi:ribosomal protein S18 acetylase RimI-like enzyme